MEIQKQYKRNWISAKRQLNRLAQEQIVSEMIENEHTDDKADENVGCANSRSVSPSQSHGDWSDSGANNIEMESVALAQDFCGLGSDSVEYDSDNEHLNDTELRYKLAEWVTEYHVKNNTVDKLLKILQDAGHRVPVTARSFLKTVVDVSVIEKSSLQYVYLGITECLTQFVLSLSESKIRCLDQLEIALNIDGLPLFKSSSYSLWPVLCSVVNVLPV